VDGFFVVGGGNGWFLCNESVDPLELFGEFCDLFVFEVILFLEFGDCRLHFWQLFVLGQYDLRAELMLRLLKSVLLWCSCKFPPKLKEYIPKISIFLFFSIFELTAISEPQLQKTEEFLFVCSSESDFQILGRKISGYYLRVSSISLFVVGVFRGGSAGIVDWESVGIKDGVLNFVFDVLKIHILAIEQFTQHFKLFVVDKVGFVLKLVLLQFLLQLPNPTFKPRNVRGTVSQVKGWR
jgi:hypothetical protein